MAKHTVIFDVATYEVSEGVFLTASRGQEIELSQAEAERLGDLGAVAKPGSAEAKAAVASTTVSGRAAPEGGEPAHADVTQTTEAGTRTIEGARAMVSRQRDENDKDVAPLPEVVHGETPGQGSTSDGRSSRARAQAAEKTDKS